MRHKFYCTNCASEVTTETVLFDMQALITGSEDQKLQILKFWMTEKELRDLQKSGTEKRADEFSCKLTFSALMGYIANKNNLDLPAAAGLTMAEMIDFVEYADHIGTTSPDADEDEEEDLFSTVTEGAEDEKPAQEEKPQKKEWSQAIKDMALKDTTYDSMEFSEGRLRDDLRLIRQLMITGDSFSFELRLLTKADDQGNQIVTGVNITYPNGIRAALLNRICPKCGAKVFAEAGTAEHKAVVFIGDQSSGKTSTSPGI